MLKFQGCTPNHGLSVLKTLQRSLYVSAANPKLTACIKPRPEHLHFSHPNLRLFILPIYPGWQQGQCSSRKDHGVVCHSALWSEIIWRGQAQQGCSVGLTNTLRTLCKSCMFFSGLTVWAASEDFHRFSVNKLQIWSQSSSSLLLQRSAE